MTRQSVTHLPTIALTPHPANIREHLDGIDDLARSIREQGIVQPLVVTEHPKQLGKYLILAGHRRHAAANRIGLRQIPCVIRHDVTDEVEHLTLMLVENLQRSDLGPVEKSQAIGALINRGMTQADIARTVGLSQATVNYYASLLELDDESLAAIKAGEIKVGDARRIVHEQRTVRRATTGEKKRGQPTHVVPAHFTKKHPLAGEVHHRCDHTDRPKVGTVGCGQCWEQTIRDDATGLLEEQGGVRSMPTPSRHDVDPVAVDRRLNGDTNIRLNIGEKEIAVRRLNAEGLSDQQIADQSGMTSRQVLRIRQRLDLPAVPEHAAAAGRTA